jgi:hypothetical protein
LSNNTVTIGTLGIERAVIRRRIQVTHGIIPMLIIIKTMVKDSGVPIKIRSKDDMRQAVPFIVCIGAHGNVRKPPNNVDGYDITIQS